MSEKKKSNYEQLENQYDPTKDTMEHEFQNALKDLSVAARKLQIKGGRIKSGMETAPRDGE